MNFIKKNMRPAVREAGAGFAGHPIEATHKVPTKTGCNFSGAKYWWVSAIINAAIIVVLFVLGLLLTGCGTVIPKTVQANVASYDGGAQNSGLLSMTTNTTGEVTGAIITPHARDRYNALISIYSTNFFPALTFDAGITPMLVFKPQIVPVNGPPPEQSAQTYLIDAEHLVDFMRMNRWNRQTLNPQPSTLKHP
jgi:hypothetical protein